MLNSNRTSVSTGSGRFLLAALFLAALLLVSGTVTVEAQMKSYSLGDGAWTQMLNVRNHAPYYLPSYDARHWMFDWVYFNFYPSTRSRGYEEGYWYPWTFRWGRYDIPNQRWWSFGEGFYDDYGTGWAWISGDPQKSGELKAIQTVEREQMATRARSEAPRMTSRRRMGSSGISASQRGSSSSSGGGRSIGSSGGGSSGGSSGGGKRK